MADRIVTRDNVTGVISATLDPDSFGNNALLSVSMTNATTAAAQLGTPAFVRSGPLGYDPPVTTAPILTTGIAVPSYPTDTGLRIELAQTTSGLWMYPLTGLASIPANGVAIEVDIANQTSGMLFYVMPIARFTAGEMASGMAMQHWENFSQIDSYQIYTEPAQPFARLGTAGSVMNYGFSTTPNYNRSISKVRYEVKADGPQTPARWRISAFASNTASNGINPTAAAGVSGVTNPIDNGVGNTPRFWDGLPRPTLAIGIGRSSPGLGNVLLTRIQVFPL